MWFSVFGLLRLVGCLWICEFFGDVGVIVEVVMSGVIWEME